MIEAITLGGALAFVVLQHVLIRRYERRMDIMHSVMVKVALGKVSVTVDGEDIYFKEKTNGM